MLARNDLADYLLDNYGTCTRNADCYWGKNAHGQWDGCLRVGWKGRGCKHWAPLGAITLDDLAASARARITSSEHPSNEEVMVPK